MERTDAMSSAVHVHYSPTAKTSVGYLGEIFREDDYLFNGVQVNNLLKRWNKPASQANIYLKSGLGLASSDGTHRPAAFTGVAMDWEDQRWFTSYSVKAMTAGSIDGAMRQKARVGVAPYIGDYGDLHTWLMLETAHQPNDTTPVTVTPLIRLFQGPVLIEAGYSLMGDGPLLNFAYRF